MKKYCLILLFYAMTLTFAADGFYKDIFMDGGCNLYSNDFIYAADSLGLSWEFIASEDDALQDDLFLSNDWDDNGHLLYPDGEPRYRTIYTNGGTATSHGNSLGENGRQRVRDFFYAGGSYTGSCAGAFISSIHYETYGTWNAYYHIWPGRTSSTGLMRTPTGHFVEEDSPLLAYYDFGGDMYIDDVWHTGGCHANTDVDWPEETEVLLRFDYPPRDMHMEPSCWAYKHDSLSGRLVVIGSHPEDYENGERMNLMAAIFLYAIDGNGKRNIKATLDSGIPRIMNRETLEEMPEYSVIGDMQYHHFTIESPEGIESLDIDLDGEDGYHFNLYARYEDFAIESEYDYAQTLDESDKNLIIPYPDAGTWHITVELSETCGTSLEEWGYDYVSNQEILNGLPYVITATLEPVSTAVGNFTVPEKLAFIDVSPNPFNSQAAIMYSQNLSENAKIEIFNQQGHKIRELTANPSGRTVWNGVDAAGRQLSSGVFHIRLIDGNITKSKKALLIR